MNKLNWWTLHDLDKESEKESWMTDGYVIQMGPLIF